MHSVLLECADSWYEKGEAVETHDTGREEEVFISVRGEGSIEIVRKRSRFIGWVGTAFTVDEAEEKIESFRAAHPQASHVCFAYRIGRGANHVRFSDDGEPSGTAGRPILEVLERREVVNVLGVVIRYFGGTLLGAAGLVRAYASAVAAALDEVGTSRYVQHALFETSLSYADWSKGEQGLRSIGVSNLDVAYGEHVTVTGAIPTERVERVRAFLVDLTNGEAPFVEVDRQFLPEE